MALNRTFISAFKKAVMGRRNMDFIWWNDNFTQKSLNF